MLVITPSENRAAKAEIHQISIINKIMKVSSFARIIRKSTALMFVASNNRVEITNNEPWESEVGNTGKLLP